MSNPDASQSAEGEAAPKYDPKMKAMYDQGYFDAQMDAAHPSADSQGKVRVCPGLGTSHSDGREHCQHCAALADSQASAETPTAKPEPQQPKTDERLRYKIAVILDHVRFDEDKPLKVGEKSYADQLLELIRTERVSELELMQKILTDKQVLTVQECLRLRIAELKGENQ